MNTRTLKRGASPFFQFVKDYGLIFLAIIFVIPIIYFYYKKQLQKEDRTDVENYKDDVELQNIKNIVTYTSTEKETQASNFITTKKHLHNAAKELAHHLGTLNQYNLSWDSFWNGDWWRGLTENDKDAYNVFLTFNKNDIPIVKRLYNEVYAIGKDLQKDCLRLLPQELYKKIRF